MHRAMQADAWSYAASWWLMLGAMASWWWLMLGAIASWWWLMLLRDI